jgi:hypothetical protein
MQAPPWDDRVGESPGGGEWFDQGGSFYGAGPGSQQKAIAMQGLRAVQPARQQLLWDGSNSEGLDPKLQRAEKLASMREDVGFPYFLCMALCVCTRSCHENYCSTH